jgi:hypothetical protein
MQNANPVSTPLNHSVKLVIPVENKNNKPSVNEPYAKAVGSLMYASLGTRPDISFTVQHLSQFVNCFTSEHWMAIKHVFRYLKGTKSDGITYMRSDKINIEINMEIFVDTDFANRADALSIGGYVLLINGSCIAWSSKKQRTVALSTTKAEYIALTEAAKEVVWLHKLLTDLGFDITDDPTSIKSDNLGAISLAHDPSFHARTTYIKITYHFIRE